MDVFWQHPEKVQTWGHAALTHYQAEFKADRMAREYLQIYRSLL
jgi:hypothetical protein